MWYEETMILWCFISFGCDYIVINHKKIVWLIYVKNFIVFLLFYTFAVYLTLKITFHKLKHKKGKWGANIPENKYDDKCNQDIIQHNTNCQFLHNTYQECYQKLVLHSLGL